LEHEDILADLELDIQNKIKEIRTGKAAVPENKAEAEEITAEAAPEEPKKKTKKSKKDADVDSVIDEITKE
jgi:hypothetical protein